jgi:hypothetical protein
LAFRATLVTFYQKSLSFYKNTLLFIKKVFLFTKTRVKHRPLRVLLSLPGRSFGAVRGKMRSILPKVR